MQHIELRLADVGERQALYRSHREGDRLGHVATRSDPPPARRVAHPARPARRRRRRDHSRVAGMTPPRPLPGSGLLPDPGAHRLKGTLRWLSSRMS